MTIDELLEQGRTIWGDDKLTLPEIVTRLGVVYGDICRETRATQEGDRVDIAALQKELGNIIFSMIRWSADLGYDPNECIELAKQAQASYAQKLRAR